MEFTEVKPENVTKEDVNRPILYSNLGEKEYGVIANVNHLGVHIHFGMNENLLILKNAKLFFVNFKQ